MAPIYSQRPLDPAYVSKLMTRKSVNINLKKEILKALRTYNKSLQVALKNYEKACNKATDKLENKLKTL